MPGQGRFSGDRPLIVGLAEAWLMAELALLPSRVAVSGIRRGDPVRLRGPGCCRARSAPVQLPRGQTRKGRWAYPLPTHCSWDGGLLRAASGLTPASVSPHQQ